MYEKRCCNRSQCRSTTGLLPSINNCQFEISISRSVPMEKPSNSFRMSKSTVQDQQDQPARDPVLVEALLQFSASLFHSIRVGQENVIFSPLSIHVCLNLLSLGVTRNSKTANEMRAAMGYANMAEATPDKIHQTNAQLIRLVFNSAPSQSGAEGSALLGMINYLIVNSASITPQQAYTDKVNKFYPSSLKQIKSSADQLQVIGEINDWCKEAGLSENFLTRDDLKSSDLILLNAVRVESSWFDQFVVSREPSLFYNHGRQEGAVEMPLSLRLHRKRTVFFEVTNSTDSAHGAINEALRNKSAQIYDELAGLEFRVLKMDLFGQVSYTIIEPLKSGPDELANLENALTSQTEPAGLGRSRMSQLSDLLELADKVLVNLTMPGFKFEQDIDLEDHLRAIGLGRLFDRSARDDTREMAPSGYMAVGIKHRAFIEVNEKGIKAAAITKMMLCGNSLQPDRPINIKVERPFMFWLRLARLPLFVGHFVRC